MPSSPAASAPNTPKDNNFFGINEPSIYSTEPDDCTLCTFALPPPPTLEKKILATVKGRLGFKAPTRSLRINIKDTHTREPSEGKDKDRKDKKERQDRIRRAYQRGQELWDECEKDNLLILQRMERIALIAENLMIR
jgi:hypothetical protein